MKYIVFKSFISIFMLYFFMKNKENKMKNTRDELIKVGAYIESKNGVEFSVRISKIEDSRVTVSWRRDGEEMCQIIDKSLIKAYSDGSGLYVPNWTINR